LNPLWYGTGAGKSHKPTECFFTVALNSFAFCVRPPDAPIRQRKTALGCPHEPIEGFRKIPLHALAVFVPASELVLRFRVSVFGRFAKVNKSLLSVSP